MAASLPQNVFGLSSTFTTVTPAVANASDDAKMGTRPARVFYYAEHGRNGEFVESSMGAEYGGEEDEVGKEAARDVVEITPAAGGRR